MVEANINVDEEQQVINDAKQHSAEVHAAPAAPGEVKKSGAYADPAFLAELYRKDAAAAEAAAKENAAEESKTVVEADPDQPLSEIFVKLDDGVPSDVITSLCMECKASGETRFMYTKIPMFKEIIISSFYCDECGFRNNEVQFGGKLSDYGCSYKLACIDQDGLNRSVVKSEYATIKIPELDFEIPPQTQKGSIKTVEGYLLSAIEGIEELQEDRRKFNP